MRMIDGTIRPFLITAILGQGFKSTLCILIFYNFHRQVPQSLSIRPERNSFSRV